MFGSNMFVSCISGGTKDNGVISSNVYLDGEKVFYERASKDNIFIDASNSVYYTSNAQERNSKIFVDATGKVFAKKEVVK